MAESAALVRRAGHGAMERGRAPPPPWRGPWILCLLPALAGGEHRPVPSFPGVWGEQEGDGCATPGAGQPLAAGEAAYEEWRATGVRGRAVELSCGPVAAAPPAVVFWSFTPQGEGLPRAVAVGSGREVALAPGTGMLGRVTLRNGTLELRELRVGAQGRFLCQGLFPERGRLRVGYAAVLLRVLGKSLALASLGGPAGQQQPVSHSPRSALTQ